MSDALENAKSMSIIVTKGTLDWAYPPFILGTTAAAMGVNVSMFFTFYGLTLLKKDLDLKISTLGNPAMQMPMMGMHMAMPNVVSMIPGVDRAATLLRSGEPAVVGCIRQDRLLLDMLTVADADLPELAEALKAVLA